MADDTGYPTLIHPGLPDPAADGDAGVHVDRLRALQAFNARLVCMPVDEASYADVVAGARRVIGCDACALFLVDRATDELVLRAADGYRGLQPGLRVPVRESGSMHAQAFSEEYLVHVADVAGLEGLQPLAAGVASAVALPIISFRGPVGVFDFGSRKPAAFTATELGMCTMLVDQMSYSLENIRLVNELSRSRDAVIRGMALLAEIRDTHIREHLHRMCAYAGFLAGLLADRPAYPEATPQFVDTIARAAALHDVGKVGIPDAILLKPGKLTEPEFAVMRSHTEIGAELLEGLINDYGRYAMISMGAEVARCHHEKWDGTGYPAGLKGREIPLSARIVAIADVYDALTSRRVYKDAWTHEETAKTMQAERGKHFDPELLDIFLGHSGDLARIRRGAD
ncbi:MAG: HD domain-containing protein [bacterium]|nr:HD domain-containing protein [bacterium]MBK7769708.1 HD domain-containing protein [bacterium]